MSETVQIILILGCLVATLSIVVSKIPPRKNQSEESLKAIADMWKERGDRLLAAKDEADSRHDKLHEQYLELVRELRKLK